MRIIKKYPNRRLYDTEKSAYITLSAVHDIIRKGEEFKVVDAESGEDITRTILVQIIIEQENGDSPIFTTEMMTKFIRFYDDAAQNVFGDYLEKSLQMFSEQQARLKQQLGQLPIPKMVQDMAEKNLEIWQGMQKRFFDMASTGFAPKTKTPEDDPAGKKDKKSK